LAINLTATSELADALEPSQMLVFPSTTSFYGSSGDVSTEEATPAPVSLYGASKWQAEQRIMQRANSIALRWATVFGVSARMRSSLLVNDFAARAVHDRVINLYDADSRRTFMHISDVVRGYLFALENASRMIGSVFNMGAESLNLTKREVARHIQKRQPCEIVDSGLADKDVRNFTVSFKKANALGFETTATLDQGVVELIKLFRFYTPDLSIRPI
jgi:nucleoside-diphosphate-sugar epimerase